MCSYICDQPQPILLIDMHNIYHDLPIKASSDKVFDALASAEGISAWWSLSTKGAPVEGELYELDFGPGYLWEARVVSCTASSALEWEMTKADEEWTGTRVGFRLVESSGKTTVQFYHTGWPENNDHYRSSSYCWAMYLRILKRTIENGELVPYEDRLNV